MSLVVGDSNSWRQSHEFIYEYAYVYTSAYFFESINEKYLKEALFERGAIEIYMHINMSTNI